jgi:LmbE family N-acetylglucosaminyl deacetylase
MRIVGFGAHPDDVEIFFFGTLAAARNAGAEIGWVIATDGARGGDRPVEELRAVRRREAETAAALLGVTPVFLDRADGDLASDAEASKLVEAEILRLKPDLVITHAPNDYHPDHRALSRLVSDGARFRAPVLFADTLMGVGFQPSHYVDITAHFATKAEAIRAHVSQRPERFVAAAETWSRFRSLQCNAAEGYAEAFRFEPVYPFSDVRALLPQAPAVRALNVVKPD